LDQRLLQGMGAKGAETDACGAKKASRLFQGIAVAHNDAEDRRE
jgi:hypothetical protein